MGDGRKARIAVRLPAWAKGLSVPERHQLRIALDTVENPLKALLGGPSVEEAEGIIKTLRGRAGGGTNASRMAGRIAGDVRRGGSHAIVSAARELAAGLREAAGWLDRLGGLADGSDPTAAGSAMPAPELVDLFLDAMSGVESRMFHKRRFLDGIQYPRP